MSTCQGGAVDLVPTARLDEWLGDRLVGPGQLRVERVTSGHSNELFRIDRGGEAWVLRRPPRIPNAPTAHDMAREFIVLNALEGTPVPHPTPYAFCDDSDVIGAPFYVMEQVTGTTVFDAVPRHLAGYRGEIAFALVDALAALHRVDWHAAGLGHLGRPDGYTERQASRWSRQLEAYAFRDIPELEDAARWLASTCPGTWRSALIHGDYGLHNVMFAPAGPPSVAAIVDWETSTIGDPLADLGYLLADWLEPGEVDAWGALGMPCGVEGFPTRAALVDRYCVATDQEVDLDRLTWYRVLGQFKIAVILEGSFGRFVRGESDDDFFASLEHRVPLLARHALAIADGTA